MKCWMLDQRALTEMDVPDFKKELGLAFGNVDDEVSQWAMAYALATLALHKAKGYAMPIGNVSFVVVGDENNVRKVKLVSASEEDGIVLGVGKITSAEAYDELRHALGAAIAKAETEPKH